MQTWPELSEDQQEAYILTNYNDLRTLTEALAIATRRCGQRGVDAAEAKQLQSMIHGMEVRRELILAKYNARTKAGVLIRPPSRSDVIMSQERAEQTASLAESKEDVAAAVAYTVSALELQQAIQPEPSMLEDS